MTRGAALIGHVTDVLGLGVRVLLVVGFYIALVEAVVRYKLAAGEFAGASDASPWALAGFVAIGVAIAGFIKWWRRRAPTRHAGVLAALILATLADAAAALGSLVLVFNKGSSLAVVGAGGLFLSLAAPIAGFMLARSGHTVTALGIAAAPLPAVWALGVAIG